MKNRSTHYTIALTRRRNLLITLRRFRVARAQRSKKRRQLVLNFRIFKLRQLVFETRVLRPVGRPKSKRVARISFWSFRVSTSFALVSLGVAGLLFFGSQLVATRSLQPVHVFAAPTAIHKKAAPKVLTASQPTHISLPAVGIDADMTPVGLDAAGSISLPPLFAWEAGWYTGSPTPGQLGPAVIVGHVDTYKGISVFWRLREVQAGDSVLISRADGSTAHFVITGLAQYDQHTFPTDTVYQNLDYAGLKLITCGGTFDQATQHYTENTVVTAALQL